MERTNLAPHPPRLEVHPTDRAIINVAFVAAPLAMAVALLLAGYSQTNGAWWTAAVQLAVLGGITIMIYGVNIRAVPMHSGRSWRFHWLVGVQVGAGILGAWMVGLGYGQREDWLIRSGHILAFLGAILFYTNLRLLFSQPGPPRQRIAWDERTPQQKADRLAIPFTIISSFMLLAGTGLGVALDYWEPAQGRWDLVWAHILLLGFFFPMASGTSYHTLARWSGRDFPFLQLIRVHQVGLIIGLPAMAIALGWDIDWLFRVGAVTMAVAMICWAINVFPVAWKLSPAIRTGISLALIFMLVGIAFGVAFAIDESLGPRLRTTHVVANLFGFAGLLISGFGYRYVPQIAGREDMRWPALRMPQIVLMAAGCAVGMLFMGLRMYGHVEPEAVFWSCLVGAVGMGIFSVNTAATFATFPGSSADFGPLATYDQH